MSDETPSKSLLDLREIVLVCKRNGILKFKGAGFELDFTQEAVARPARKSDEAPAATIAKASFNDVLASLGVSPEEE